ncbi:COX15/CtaA family protein [Vreelandella utahensis]|uniref:COX15/CtaA family protein n=1 Tax=Vreelandella halophila TaxID=86177 RepID=UPI00098633D0|nr:COX15/CtaA family protein [Halomonas utahensis]
MSTASGPSQAIAFPRLRQAALSALVLAAIVIMLGAWTRLVDAGLGCPDWPGCYGHLTVPSGEETITKAQARFPEAPFDASKGWPEMIHRYAAGTLGLVIFGIAVACIRHRRTGAPAGLAGFAAGFVVLQAAFGAWTVTLSLWPQVVAAHLLGGFTTFCLMFLLFRRLEGRTGSDDLPPEPRAGVLALRPWLYAGLFLLVLQIALGAWTAANYAAVACTELPTCQGALWPEMNFAEGFNFFQSVGPNYLGGQLGNEARVAIHQSHRIGALVVLVVLGALFWAVIRKARGSALAGAAGTGLALLLVQIVLGVLNILLQVPLAIAIAHNAFGAFLLLGLVNLLVRVERLRVAPPNP